MNSFVWLFFRDCTLLNFKDAYCTCCPSVNSFSNAGRLTCAALCTHLGARLPEPSSAWLPCGEASCAT
jgi:hypothetical protein